MNRFFSIILLLITYPCFATINLKVVKDIYLRDEVVSQNIYKTSLSQDDCAVMEVELKLDSVRFDGQSIVNQEHIKKKGVYRLLINPTILTTNPTIQVIHPELFKPWEIKLVDNNDMLLLAKCGYKITLLYENVCAVCGQNPCLCCEKCHSYPCKCKKIKKGKKKKKVEPEKEEKKEEMKWYEEVFHTIADVARKIYGAISKAIAFLLSLIFLNLTVEFL